MHFSVTALCASRTSKSVVFFQESLGVSQSEAPRRPDPNLDIPLLQQSIRHHFPADVETVVLTKALVYDFDLNDVHDLFH